MGCDIHLYCEYKMKDSMYWQDFGGRMNPGRHYAMFGIMATGVRYDSGFSFDPKGLPENMAWEARNDSRLWITDDGSGDGCCTLSKAKQWAKEDGSVKIYNNDKGDPIAVDHPDWHSRSWLTLAEYEKAITYSETISEGHRLDVAYYAIRAALQGIESRNYDTRIVFWFDN